jgi:hypothetical protein
VPYLEQLDLIEVEGPLSPAAVGSHLRADDQDAPLDVERLTLVELISGVVLELEPDERLVRERSSVRVHRVSGVDRRWRAAGHQQKQGRQGEANRAEAAAKGAHSGKLRV